MNAVSKTVRESAQIESALPLRTAEATLRKISYHDGALVPGQQGWNN